MIVFEPGASVRWSEEDDEDLKILRVELPARVASGLADAIQPKAGVYALPDLDPVVFRVEKSYIRAQDGSVQEVIG